jgi:hypothetical protein
MGKKGQVVQSQLFIELNPDEEHDVSILKEYGKTLIYIVSSHSHLPISKMSSIFLYLEFCGMVLRHF